MTTQSPAAESVSLSDATMKVWDCKIGTRGNVSLSPGADGPMRQAIAAEYLHQTGVECEFLFSGWGGSLNESELAVVENRLPDPEVRRAELLAELATLPKRELDAGGGEYVLVPREATHEMEYALSRALDSGDYSIGECLSIAVQTGEKK